ncbi:MAG: hypothetical protein ACI8RZ_006604 [Myxococcota bacterium]|jgi:hypothetical protein
MQYTSALKTPVMAFPVAFGAMTRSPPQAINRSSTRRTASDWNGHVQ